MPPTPSANTRQNAGTTIAKRPSVAVVLGSPGASAFAALPMLKALDEAGVRADLVVATGGGGLIASLWSAGYDMNQIEGLFTRFFTREAYHDLETSALSCAINERMVHPSSSRTGCLYSSQSLLRAYDVIFKDLKLEDLAPKTLLFATDVVQGKGFCIESGPVAKAAAACGAFFPVQAPVEIDGRLLADGSTISPLPVYEAVKRGADLIISVYLEEKGGHKPENFLESFLLLNRISTRSLRQAQLFTAIDMHHYEICIAEVPFKRTVLPWDVEHIPAILREGRLVAQDKIPEIKSMIKIFGINPGSRRPNSKSGNFTYHSSQNSPSGGKSGDK